MKNLLVATTAIVGTMFLSNSANAEDFDNSTFETVLYSDRFQFSFSGDNDEGFDSVSAGVYFLSYTIGETYNANLYTELEYNYIDESVTLSGEYQMYKEFDFGEVYGSAAVDYVALEDDFSNGDWYMSPYAGVVYDVSESVATFVEVGYTWDMSNDWDTSGGYGEVGVDFMINEDIKVTPSVVQEFDTPDEYAQMNLTVALQF